MGKKKNSYKTFVKKNKVMLAAMGGVATGIALAGVLGSEKAKALLQSVEGNVKEFSNKIANGMQSDASSASGQ
jgi:hypothetical protein